MSETMLNYDEFDKLVFNKDELNALKKIRKNGKCELEEDISSCLTKTNLIDELYVGFNSYGEPEYIGAFCLNDNGKRYFEYRKQKRMKHLFNNVLTPVAVSFITALITAVIAILIANWLEAPKEMILK